MSISTLHTIYAADFGGNLIDQVTDQSIDPGIALAVESSDGGVDTTYTAVLGQKPTISITTTGIAKALSAAGLSGLVLSSTSPGIFYWQKLAEGGTRAGAASHIKLTVNEGMCLPRTLTAGLDTVANITYDTICTWDGTNDPIVMATDQSLTGTSDADEAFVVGPVSINGTTLDSITDITVDFGITEEVQSSDGEVWPSFVGIMGRAPTITIKTNDALSLDTFGLSGSAQGATDSVMYLRKVAENGTRIANATTEHIKFTVYDGIITIDDQTGSQGDTVGSAVKITPSYDGINDVIGIDTASAIA